MSSHQSEARFADAVNAWNVLIFNPDPPATLPSRAEIDFWLLVCEACMRPVKGFEEPKRRRT